MTIRNLKAYVDGLWDWGFLDICFAPTKVKVSDVDGIVERNGHILYLEAKSLGKGIPDGQRIMLRSLAQHGCTVVVLWGHKNDPREMMIWWPHSVEPADKITVDISDVQNFVRSWFAWATVNKRAAA